MFVVNVYFIVPKTYKNGKEKKMKKVRDFFDCDGLVPVFKNAAKYAGKDGRIAILPDIIKARLDSKPGDVPWETWYTTLSAEYFGVGADGRKKIIVAHGIGPMSTLDGILKVYKHEYSSYKNNTRRRGGRITREEFLKLEAGEYGEVYIIDYEGYIKRYEYPFMEILTSEQALSDPVLAARFGDAAADYVLHHEKCAREWHKEQLGFDPENKYNLDSHQKYLGRRRKEHLRDSADKSSPYIIKIGDASNCNYEFTKFNENEEALAHLLSIGRLCHSCHQDGESLMCDVNCHEWSNANRFLSIPKGALGNGIFKGPDASEMLKQYWQELLLPIQEPYPQIGFCKLMQIDDQWFTEYSKKGARMDTWEPEFVVISFEEVGKPVEFFTSGGHGTFFFKYGIKEVQAIAPAGVNAYYTIGDCWQTEKENGVRVQFCKINADTSKRVMRQDALKNNYDLLMQLTEKSESAV